MKFISSILLTALVSFVAGLYLPWWSVAMAAFIVAVIIPLASWKSFLSGFLGVFFLWAMLAWWIDSKNNSILSQKIAQLLQLGSSSILLILVTAFIGALVAGFAGLTGSYMRKRPA
jgi:hypothetical protein